MALYQCRGYVRSISSDGKDMFVGIGASTKFDCKENSLRKTPTGSFDSTVYNILMEVQLTPPAPKKSPAPVYCLTDDPKALALSEDCQFQVEETFFSKVESFIESAFETESTFIIEETAPDNYRLTYIQVGPENNDE